jgi:hypothetical protein
LKKKHPIEYFVIRKKKMVQEKFILDENNLNSLLSMGFSKELSQEGLKQ